jgi:tyrosine-protein kinase Etk/Wzc
MGTAPTTGGNRMQPDEPVSSSHPGRSGSTPAAAAFGSPPGGSGPAAFGSPPGGSGRAALGSPPGGSRSDASPAQASAPDTTLDFLVRLLRWRRFILLNTALVAAAAVVISLLLPKWYRAEVSVLPPKEESISLGGLVGLGSELGMAGRAMAALSSSHSLPIWATPSDFLAGILRSRNLREAVIVEHDLTTVYEVDNVDQALEEFDRRVDLGVRVEGILWLAVLDKSPERAAAVAASCLEKLDAIQREKNRGRAADVRRFIESRLAATHASMSAAEESLRVFEETYGLLAPEEQARALVQTIAQVEVQRLTAIVERDALRSQVGPDHPDVQRYAALVTSLDEAKASLEGEWSPPGGQGPTAIIGLGQLPGLSLEFVRRYREAEIQAAVFELLTQLLEQYRIQEVRDVPTIQVLDAPTVPLEKHRPRRGLICVVATLLAFLLSLFVAWQLERATHLAERDPRQYAQLERLLAGVGLRFLLPRR